MLKPTSVAKPSLLFDRKRLQRTLKSHINLVLFSDYDRTRSYRFSALWGVFCFTFISVTVLWALIATAFLYTSLKDLRLAQRSVSRALGIVLDYQMRVDGLLEKNLDRPQTNDYTKKVITPLPVVQSGETAPTEKAVAKDPATDGAVVTVSNPRFVLEGNRLDFTMDINNSSADKRIGGYVVAVLSIAGETGKTINIAAPAAVQLDDSGTPKDIKRGFNFSIRRFKEKQFSFALPQGTTKDSLLGMTVLCLEESGTKPKKFIFKVSL